MRSLTAECCIFQPVLYSNKVVMIIPIFVQVIRGKKVQTQVQIPPTCLNLKGVQPREITTTEMKTVTTVLPSTHQVTSILSSYVCLNFPVLLLLNYISLGAAVCGRRKYVRYTEQLVF